MSQSDAPMSIMQYLNQQRGLTMVPNLLFDAYHDLGLNEKEMLLLLHIMRCQISAEGSVLSLSDYLMEKMQLSRSEVGFLLKNLQSRGLIQFSDPGRMKPQDLSLHLLYAQLLAWSQLPLEQRQQARPSEDAELVRSFENLFRQLNEFEYEKLRSWLNEDGWPPEIVMEALRLAALNRSLNFNYIDKTLLNWKLDGLDTLEAVRAANAAFDRRRQLRREMNETPASEGKAEYRSASRRRKAVRTGFKIGSISQDDESEEERKKRYDQLIERPR